jgi:hypothetical protein
MRLARDCSIGSLCRFLLVVALPWMGFCAFLSFQAARYEIDFKPEDTMSLELEQCDLIFRLDPSRETGGLVTLNIWKWMGTGRVQREAETVNINLRSDYHSYFFSCSATIWLAALPDMSTYHLNALNLTLTGNGKVRVEAATDSCPGLAVADSATFTLAYGRTVLKSMRVGGKAKFALAGGHLYLEKAEAMGGVYIFMVHGAVARVTTLGAAQVHMSQEQEQNTHLCGAQTSRSDNASEAWAEAAALADRIDSSSEEQGGASRNVSSSRSRSLSEKRPAAGLGALQIHISGDARSPIFVMAETEGKDDHSLCEGRGATPKLADFDMDTAIPRLQHFLQLRGRTPSIAYIRLMCPSCAEGYWQALSSRAFLALSMDWFVFLTGRIIYPHHLEMDLQVLGELPSSPRRELARELALLRQSVV